MNTHRETSRNLRDIYAQSLHSIECNLHEGIVDKLRANG